MEFSRNKKSLKIIDCTFRDGGYYTDWKFSAIVKASYFEALNTVEEIKFCEVGFKSHKKLDESTKGDAYFSPVEYVRMCSRLYRGKIGLMLNMSEVLASGENLSNDSELLFSDFQGLKIDFLRIAVHAHEIEHLKELVTALRKYSDSIILNLMQISEFQEHDWSGLSNKLPTDLTCLYFADSLGSMHPDEVSAIVTKIRDVWPGEIGFHAHDNKGLALANVHAAIRAGVTWVDSTFSGMGRGAGNPPTELLLASLTNFYEGLPENVSRLEKCIRTHFEPLKNRYRWGANPVYAYAAVRKIHPTYAQNVQNQAIGYDADEIAVLNQIAQDNPLKFNQSRLSQELISLSDKGINTEQLVRIINGRQLLIIGSGKTLSYSHNHLIEYIKRHKPYVISLNTPLSTFHQLVDANLYADIFRFNSRKTDSSLKGHSAELLIAPIEFVRQGAIVLEDYKNFFAANHVISDGSFSFANDRFVTPDGSALALALIIAYASGAREILVAGVDGYPEDSNLAAAERSMLQSFDRATNNRCIVYTLTPSEHTGFRVRP